MAMKEICGGKIERDTESPSLNTNEGKNAKPKHRKWKMQARQDDKNGEKGVELQKGPNIAKRPVSEVIGMKLESPETKRKKNEWPYGNNAFCFTESKT